MRVPLTTLDLLTRAPGAGVRQVVLDDHYESALARQRAGVVEPDVRDEDDPAEIFFTSGSTGMPKGAVLTHRNLYLHAIHNALTNDISGEDVILHLVPLFHVNGWGTPHYLTGLGGTHVMLPRFDAGEVLRLIEAHGVTRVFAVPAMVRMLLDHSGIATRDLTSVRTASIGGSPVSAAMLTDIEAAFGCTAICGYGMTRDGWLRTGDLAVVRPDGYLQIVDRKKDLIISGGENIATPEVEHALCEHPAVREAAVVGRADERWGEVPVAFVSLHAGATAAEAELIEFVRGRLAHFKAPKDLVILPELPKVGTGKIDKGGLRSRPTGVG